MLGTRILELRKERNLTQQELATIIGVNRTTITGYEKNIITPAPDKLLALCEYFSITSDYLMGKSNVRNITTSKTNDMLVELDLMCDLLQKDAPAYFSGEKLDAKSKEFLLILLKSVIHSTKQWLKT